MDLRSLRQTINLTISDLSKLIYINSKRIKILERGLDIPTLHEQKKITDFFNINELDIEYFKKRKEKLIAGEGYITANKSNKNIFKPDETGLPNKLKVIDLFCGVGGLSYGFEQTGHYVTIAGIDLLHDRILTFKANHKNAYGFCDNINELNPRVVFNEIASRPDVIIGGAPCQGFSSIRPFRGLNEDDQRNDLFKSFGIYLNFFKPDWFVFENVVGLLTHKQGVTLKLLIKEFEILGYKVDFRVVNTAHFGIPQLRERLIVVGNKKKIKFRWPNPTHFYDYKSMAGLKNELCLKPLVIEGSTPALNIMEALSDLPAIKSGESSREYLDVQLTEYQKYLREDSQELSLHEATIHSAKMLNIIRNSGYNIESVSHLVTSGFSSCYSRLEPDKPSVTLTVNFVNPSSNKCIHPIQDRALTPREGARIQGFPDKFIFKGTKTQVVKQIGNAVPPILSKIIANQIYTYYSR